MKTELEIREQILALNESDIAIRFAYKNKEIDAEDSVTYLRQNTNFRLALEWVLGENESFD